MTLWIDVRLFVFYLSHGLVRVCELDISHMGKNNGNPDLVCKNRKILQSRVMSKGDPRYGLFFFYLILIIDTYIFVVFESCF